jgi:four helix bundle protein
MDTKELLARTRRFALDVIFLSDQLPNKPSGWVLGKQILGSGTSVGSNYHEAQRSRSRAEFSSKIQICQGELDETIYWLDLIRDAGLAPDHYIAPLYQEANELRAIFIAIGKRFYRGPA